MNNYEDHDFSTRLTGLVYHKLTDEVREVSERAQERLCALRSRFPELEDLQGDQPQDRRRGRRTASSARAAVLGPGLPGGEVPALVADRSPGGMSLWLDGPLGEGSVLLLRLGEGEQPEHVWAQVRYCRPLPVGGWAAGCQVLGSEWIREDEGAAQACR